MAKTKEYLAALQKLLATGEEQKVGFHTFKLHDAGLAKPALLVEQEIVRAGMFRFDPPVTTRSSGAFRFWPEAHFKRMAAQFAAKDEAERATRELIAA